MSIETEITRISTNVSDTLSAVSEMGGEVAEDATSDDMATAVRSIPVGAKIDDTAASASTTYSSQKIEEIASELNEANDAQNTEIAKKANNADLSSVAKSGSYNDLSDKPTIPTVPTTLPNPNKLILSGAVTAEYDGSSEVSVEIPTGGGSAYELPIASATQLGGVMPVAKTDEMTQSVGVDEAGGLWTEAGAGGGGVLEFTNTLLASGTIPAETGSGTWLDTGLTVGDLRKYKRFGFTVLGESASSVPLIRLFLGSLQLVNKSNNKINYIAEWEDDERRFIRELSIQTGSGWTRLNMGYVNNSFEIYSSVSIYSKNVYAADSDSVRVTVYNGTTLVDYPWEIWGVIKG